MRALPVLAGALVLLSACREEPEPVSVSVDAVTSADPCSTVILSAATTGADVAVTWSVDTLLALDVDGSTASFVAPAANRPRTVRVTATAEGPDGVATESVSVDVPAAERPAGWLPGATPGCGPFSDGVASGDPTTSSVLLWTRIESELSVDWVVARDPLLADVVASGTTSADPERDWTVHVEATGLPAGTRLWYRFTAGSDGSPLGRTRTAPEGVVESFTFAGMSCSSVFSGFFNAYQALADEDVDLVVHVGDYVYDTVDSDETERVTDPLPEVPTNLSEWRQRFRLYLSDPDFRRARAAHPWVVLWDNHDSDAAPDEAGEGTRQAFREYVPMALPDPADPTVVHRSLRWGDLVDLLIVDAHTRIEPEHILGAAQWTWLQEELASSTATWRLLGTQKLVSAFGDPSGGFVGQATDWDDWPQARTDLFAALGAHDGNLILSGDLHFAIAMDLVPAPLDEGTPYDPTTGEGAVGVELLASGITRGNFDESICGGLCDDEGVALIEGIADLILNANPHQTYLEPIEQGYGVVRVTPDRAEAVLRYFPIRWITDESITSEPLVTERAANRWSRDASR